MPIPGRTVHSSYLLHFGNKRNNQTVKPEIKALGAVHVLYNAQRGGRGFGDLLCVLYEGRAVVFVVFSCWSVLS